MLGSLVKILNRHMLREEYHKCEHKSYLSNLI